MVMTTHNLADLRVADRLLVIAEGGRLAFGGTPAEGVDHVTMSLEGIVRSAAVAAERPAPVRRTTWPAATALAASWKSTRRSLFEQVAVLTRRNVELMARNRMNIAMMAGSPLLGGRDVCGPLSVERVRTPPQTAAAIAIPTRSRSPGSSSDSRSGCCRSARSSRSSAASGSSRSTSGPIWWPRRRSSADPRRRRPRDDRDARWLDRIPARGAHDTLMLGVLGLDSLAGLALGLLASPAFERGPGGARAADAVLPGGPVLGRGAAGRVHDGPVAPSRR